MTPDTNSKALLESADIPTILHERTARWIDELHDRCGMDLANLCPDRSQQVEILRLVAASEFAAATITRFADYFRGRFSRDRSTRENTEDSIRERCGEIANSGVERAKTELRQLRNQHLVLIYWRSLAGIDGLEETLRALSFLADQLIEVSVRVATANLRNRYGDPVNNAGEELALITLAMGKLGGNELNFSSDIDLVFLYTDDGSTNGRRSISAHEFFARLSRQIVALLDEVTADGFVYRVDTRLRPFGDSGPPVVSLAGFENYLLQHGRGWERYAYVKCRPLAVPSENEAVEYLRKNVIEPFVYRRYLDFGVFESLRDMKSLIAAEVEKREMQDNIKLGPGGIREMEFIAQSLQLVRGGAEPKLRQREFRKAMQQLAKSRSLEQLPVADILDAYDFLRRAENALQAIRDQQTHDLPDNDEDRARLALAMRARSWEELQVDLRTHLDLVTRQFSKVIFRPDPDSERTDLGAEIRTLWTRSASRAEWESLLLKNAFAQPAELAAELSGFAQTLERRQMDVAGEKRLARFIETLLQLLQQRSRPAMICHRVLAVAAGIARRSAYLALLNENSSVLNRLISLCDQSAYLAEEIARFPMLLDELLDPRLYTAEISAAAMQVDLDDRLAVAEALDTERKVELLAQFQRATLFRVAVADISGNLPIMKVSDRLTELAELVIAKALELAEQDLAVRHGRPVFVADDERHIAGLGVIAYGKLGGLELSYRSDLDLVFLHDSRGSGQNTDGEKPLENSMYFGRLVRRLVHFLTVRTPSGALYEIDTRLRPSGRSGLLVISVDGFEQYQEENAWTWEHQALLRSRPVAGSPLIAREFERIRCATLCGRIRSEELHADVIAMREKMRRQLDKSDDEVFDLKQGLGGIGDIEFLVQYLILKNAAEYPALLYYTDNIRQLGMLESVDVLSAVDVAQLQSAYKGFRLRSHRLALDDASALIGAHEFPEERRQVCAIWNREMG